MKMMTGFGISKLLLLAIALFFNGLAMAGTESTEVRWFSDGTPTGGWSHLTRTGGMIVLTLEGANLEPGDAHTLWWIVFNTPSACSDGVCGEDVVKADGTLEFGARMPRSGGSSGHQILFTPHLINPGEAGPETNYLLYATSENDAEVHLIVQSHGQARGGKKLLEQLSLVDINCTPRCADRQFAVHMP